MIIGIDFDGTCVTHEFPQIGKEIGASVVLKELVNNGHQLILHTMRSNKKDISYRVNLASRNYLSQAVGWFDKHEITLFGVNENPEQDDWTDSIKPYCNLYIDDSALGIPLLYNKEVSERSYVDWQKVREILIKLGYIKSK